MFSKFSAQILPIFIGAKLELSTFVINLINEEEANLVTENGKRYHFVLQSVLGMLRAERRTTGTIRVVAAAPR